MKTTIYYFSGTGNSLYVAKELQKMIPDSVLVPIAALLEIYSKEKKKLDKKEQKIKTTGDVIGIVFPCHGLTIPIPVKKFLKKLDLKESKYFFAITTRGGTIFNGFSFINKILKKKGKALHANFIINMIMNDPKLKSFIAPKSDDLETIEKSVQKKLMLIQKTITNQELYQDDISGVSFSRFRSINYVLERLISFMVHHIATKVKKYFFTNDKCSGCGTCERICLSGKISMVDDNPLWQSNVDCYFCYSCLNFCPTQAIQIYSKFYMKSYTEERGRYTHPDMRIKDMVNQKIYTAGT